MAILRGVSGNMLECGCLVGVYETYSGDLVRVVDAVGEACTRHRKGEAFERPEVRPSDLKTSRT